MADPALLARARLLVEAADAATAAVSAVGRSNKSPSNSPQKVSMSSNITISAKERENSIQQPSPLIESQEGRSNASHTSPVSSPTRRGGASSPSKASSYQHPSQTLKVSVIRGSSLVSCVSGVDIRNYLRRDSKIEIEGTEYVVKTKSNAEWSGHRFELTTDYTGETKLDAVLFIKDTLRKPLRKKNDPTPIPSHDISDAIKGLDEIVIPTFGMNKKQNQRETYNYNNNVNGAPYGGYSRQLSSNSVTVRSPSNHTVTSNDDTNLQINPQDTTRVGMNTVLSDMVSFHMQPSTIHRQGGSGYAATLMNSDQSTHENHLDNQRKLAKRRSMQKERELKLSQQEKSKKEKEMKEAKRIAMERKASELQHKTRQRVALLKKEKLARQQQELAAADEKEMKMRRGRQYADSEEYKEKMEHLRKETAERMRRKKAREKEQALRESQERRKKLNEISNSRRQQDSSTPTGFRPKLVGLVTQQRKLRELEEEKVRLEVANISRDMHLRDARENDTERSNVEVAVDGDGYYDYTEHHHNDEYTNNNNNNNNNNDDQGEEEEEVVFQPMNLHQLPLHNPIPMSTNSPVNDQIVHNNNGSKSGKGNGNEKKSPIQTSMNHPNPANSININQTRKRISVPKSHIPKRVVSPITDPDLSHTNSIHTNRPNGPEYAPSGGIAGRRATISKNNNDDDDDDDEWSDDSLGGTPSPERIKKEIDDVSRTSDEYNIMRSNSHHKEDGHNRTQSSHSLGNHNKSDGVPDDISAITFDHSPGRDNNGRRRMSENKIRVKNNSYISTLESGNLGGGYSRAFNDSALGKPPLPKKNKAFKPLKPIPLSQAYVEVQADCDNVINEREAAWK